MKKIALFFILFCLTSVNSYAANMYVNVTNNTGYHIYHLYISDVGDNSWGEDVLDIDILANGDTVRVDISGYSNPSFDIRAVDEDGDTYTLSSINVKKYDVVFTLDDVD